MDLTEDLDNMKLRHIPYKFLNEITDGFSDSNELGRGGFGVVYKGLDKDGQEIAVKLLHSMDLDDKMFRKEFDNISRLKHSNVVEFVGFCCEEEEQYIERNGKYITAVSMRRALCFEYMHNGNLQRHISDVHEGLSWQERYRIIKGICEGLKYLHTGMPSAICHLDIKPENILLDKKMTPKIADFGMSRLIGEDNTKRTVNLQGSLKYMPPEFINYQLTSKEYDIYSLGVTIIMIMVGPIVYSLLADVEIAEFVEHVHNEWRKRLKEIPGYMSLEADCGQVKKCIEIASKCIDKQKNLRPSIKDIVDHLSQTEKDKNDQASATKEGGNSMGSTEGMDSTKPRHMPYKLLKKITGGFSDGNMLGRGKFGVVYKGVDKDGQQIAVKLLPFINRDDKEFRKAVEHVSLLKHSNIIQFVGYCSEDWEEYIKHNGKLIPAVLSHRALCFEYMHNGSLELYLSDEHQGLSWQVRYRIIKGICYGLKYLHTRLPSPIVHLDLKPANIMLDENMTPKISGFILSRLIGKENTKRTANLTIGTPMYMPPEYIMYGLISKEYDIYSLGVTIIMIVVGPKGYSLTADMELDEFVELVHMKWRERLQKIPGYKSFEADSEQVKKCIEIASKCIEQKKSRRPSIELIVDLLSETEKHKDDITSETQELGFAFNESYIRPISTELLDIYPPQLHFAFTPNKSISRSLQLTNKSQDCVAVRLQSKGSKSYKMPLFGIVPPRSKCTLVVTAREQKKPSRNESLTLESVIVREGDLSMTHTDTDSAILEYRNIFKKARETDGNNVHELMFPVVCAPPGDATISSQPLLSEAEIVSNDFAQVLSMDVHPTKPWIMTSNYRGNVVIWNYKKQETQNFF